MNGRNDAGGARAGGRRRWWIAVAAIALVVAGVLVFAGREDPGPGTDAETPSLEPPDPAQTGIGSLTIGGEPAEPLLDGRSLTDRLGEEVLGSLVPVDSPIVEGIFWVGEGDAVILLVEPLGEETPVGEDDAVTFRGTLRALDDELRASIFGADERRLESQGAYVAVEELARQEP